MPDPPLSNRFSGVLVGEVMETFAATHESIRRNAGLAGAASGWLRKSAIGVRF